MTRTHSSAPIIWVEGVIGAGKSTLAAELGRRLNGRVFYEPVEGNPYLSKFYDDHARWAWPMQIYMLAERYAMQRLASAEAFNGTPCVLDRGLPGDRVFASVLHAAGFISDLEIATYERFYDIMTADLRPPAYLVYLDLPPAVALHRIQGRARACETNAANAVTEEYLEQLRLGYERLLTDIAEGHHAWARATRIITCAGIERVSTSEIADAVLAEVRRG